ncbi:hypothetical protein GBA52_028778 [Prunus armeniaca]|nr:hypothetical protein GBA52_028778 [Prunus armeniaca]
MAGRSCYRDALPFMAMVTMECANVGLNTLFKAATLRGMSYHVFVVYSYSVAALFLLPAPFISNRSRVLPPLNFSIMSKVLLLGIIGTKFQCLEVETKCCIGLHFVLWAIWVIFEQYCAHMGLALEGPVYVTMFKPLSMAIAVAMGVIFLDDTLHLGRFDNITNLFP